MIFDSLVVERSSAVATPNLSVGDGCTTVLPSPVTKTEAFHFCTGCPFLSRAVIVMLFNPLASGSTLVGNTVNAPFVWLSTAALVNDVQGWLDAPATNFGWALINANEGIPQNFRAFYTHDFSDAALHPQLQITFTPVPEPSSLLFLFLGAAGLLATARPRRT